MVMPLLSHILGYVVYQVGVMALSIIAAPSDGKTCNP
jgi:hypothetical protein